MEAKVEKVNRLYALDLGALGAGGSGDRWLAGGVQRKAEESQSANSFDGIVCLCLRGHAPPTERLAACDDLCRGISFGLQPPPDGPPSLRHKSRALAPNLETAVKSGNVEDMTVPFFADLLEVIGGGM